MEEEIYPLNTNWILWYHPLDEPNWTKDTYIKLTEISTLEKFFKTYNSFSSFNKGMFFLMRKDIFPQWEDESNINGGYWSFKIPKNISDDAWKNLSIACIGESLTKNCKDMQNINGISFSPKINNSIIKILNRDSTKSDSSQLTEKIKNLHPSTAQYKPHIENKDEFVN